MRFYKIRQSEGSNVVVVAEIAAFLDRDTWAFTLPPEDVDTVVSRAELESLPGGRRALLAWAAGDDSMHENFELLRLDERFDTALRWCVDQGDTKAAEVMAKATPKEKDEYLSSHRPDGSLRDPDEEEAMAEEMAA